MANALTGTDLPPNEQESAVLRYIAQLRAAGMSDDDIFSGFTQGGGNGYLPYIAEMAGIQSSYNLGRGSLAQNAQDAYYKQFGSPYNVVGALQYQRDNPQTSGMLTDPTIGSIQPSGGGIYSNYINGILTNSPAGGGVPPPATSPGGALPLQGGASPGAYYGFNSPEEAMAMQKYFAAGGGQGGIGTAASVNPTGQSWVDAWRAYHPGEPDPVPGYATSAMNTGAQQSGARLLGSSLNGVGVGGGFRDALNQGKVPGFNQLNERQMGLLSPDQQAGYMGLVGSTGRVSDPAAAYQKYLQTYAVR